jgi:hypothetical protein
MTTEGTSRENPKYLILVDRFRPQGNILEGPNQDAVPESVPIRSGEEEVLPVAGSNPQTKASCSCRQVPADEKRELLHGERSSLASELL